MAGEDQEKTEEATSKKIEDAKKDGNVPKSQDISGFITLIVAIGVLLPMLGVMKDQVVSLYNYYQSLIGTEITLKVAHQITINTLFRMLLMVLPICICVAIAGVLASVMQFGFIFTTKPITPDLNKINPIKGLKNLFSLKKVIDSIKIVVKVSAVFGIAFYFFLQFIKELPKTLFFTMFDQLSWLKEKMLILVGVMLIVLLAIALIDLLIVRLQYFKDLRMSKQEVKDEYKQMEGDPQVKARIRRAQMEAGRKRMMQQVPQADVVITNPTHYAIALRYDRTKEDAPVVLAKGVDMMALQIRKIATENGVEIVENPPLARELYKLCDVDEMIPANMFKAVAEVLSFVYMGNEKKFKGRMG
ncbi:flagellar biosynthesis protein FlhB [Campylobacter pinnipediorum subsp. pinnipediorum]|uniref:Flagellar biosynthetic protein FlhB n=2 Tax=Campylobacter TaxID=194 RepID=A0AAX0LC41_9BACT|nr:flagellar biosynthesis protein FlhB [Campylobacter pinnipediorum]OPA82058.1 flagellar biosynthesis protein FlhB [Campylobacter pinnipediorum subsp. pinnipediorum]